MPNADFHPETGQAIALEAGLLRVLAPNPSPMTLHGTNSYVLGTGTLAVIDPGPLSDAHLRALLAAIDGRKVSNIVVTHSHLDHSPLAAPLAQATGAEVVAFGDGLAGRSDIMTTLAEQGFAGGGEGMDWDFAPDRTLADGEEVIGDGWTLRAIHTPGHIGNHICLAWNDAILSGDHVMGWSTSLVSPPDGDVTEFMASCARLLDIPARVYYPGHGDPILNPLLRVRTLIDHRQDRTAQIVATLRSLGASDLETLTHTVYADVNPALFPAASRNLFAHLVDLFQRGEITCKPQLSSDAVFVLR